MSFRFVLVYRTGGQYKEWHVRRLIAQLREYCSKRFDIHVITDEDTFEKPRTDDTVIVHYVSRGVADLFPGWWLKLMLFHRGIIKPGSRYLYLDLDTTIVANIDRLVSRVIEAEPSFMAMQDVYRGIGHIQSSMMAFTPNNGLNDIYAKYTGGPADNQALFERGGDQEFIQYCLALAGNLDRVLYFQDMMPGYLASYKADCIGYKGGRRAPKGTSVVIYHGQPKPWDTEGQLYA